MAPRSTSVTPVASDPLMALAQQVAALAAEVRAGALAAQETASDAKHAREGVIAIKAALETQNVPEQIAKLTAAVEAGDKAVAGQVSDLRADLVNAIDKEKARVKDVTDDLDKRLKSLEDDRTERRGAGKIITWVSKNAPWLSGLVAGLMGVLIGERMSGG